MFMDKFQDIHNNSLKKITYYNDVLEELYYCLRGFETFEIWKLPIFKLLLRNRYQFSRFMK